jgi:hypothetical protein
VVEDDDGDPRDGKVRNARREERRGGREVSSFPLSRASRFCGAGA